MTISLENARASVISLTGTGAFDTIRRNLSCHADYHFKEGDARGRVARGAAPVCGYYLRVKVTRTEKNKAGTIEQPLNEERQKNPKYRKQWIAQPPVVTREPATVADDGGHLGFAALTGKEVGYYRSAQDPENSFLRVCGMPKGYAGVAVVRNQADQECLYVVAAVERVASTGNGKLITHYPAAQSWLDQQTALR